MIKKPEISAIELAYLAGIIDGSKGQYERLTSIAEEVAYS